VYTCWTAHNRKDAGAFLSLMIGKVPMTIADDDKNPLDGDWYVIEPVIVIKKR
jgi:hypothetical protein